MVRQKNRWLLVQFDFENDIIPCPLSETATTSKSGKKRKLQTSETSSKLSVSQSSQSTQLVNSTDIYRSLQDALTQNFGLVGASAADVQVRLYDPSFRLAIIKVSRDKYSLLRSSLTLLTQIKQGGDELKVVASTIAVSGSARTARNATWGEMHKRFYRQGLGSFGKNNGEPWTKKKIIEMEKNLQELENRLGGIDSAC